jgi:hypothetical protein
VDGVFCNAHSFDIKAAHDQGIFTGRAKYLILQPSKNIKTTSHADESRNGAWAMVGVVYLRDVDGYPMSFVGQLV